MTRYIEEDCARRSVAAANVRTIVLLVISSLSLIIHFRGEDLPIACKKPDQ